MEVTIRFGILFIFLSCLISCNENKGGQSNNYHGDVYLSDLFDVRGATSVVKTAKTGDSTLVSSSANQENDLLKIMENGAYQSIFNKVNSNWNLKIAVMELGPDGSLYVGLDWGIWIRNDYGIKQKDQSNFPDFSKAPEGQNVALFKINPNGFTEIVDPDIQGMGQFYNKSFLAKKQIQFDSEGSVYYLGRQGQTTVLKKKTKEGKITQIGSSRMEVRDFMVSVNGMVIFNGANQGDWDTQWLRIFRADGSVFNIYYRENSGWLNSYFLDKNNNLILVGYNLSLGNDNRIYNGIVRVNLTQGKVNSYEELMNDSIANQQFQGVGFSSAKQLMMGEDGSVYAILPQYGWSVPHDKIMRIIDSNGVVNIKEFPSHIDYNNIKLAKVIGDYIIYLSSLNGSSALLKIDLNEDGPVTEITAIRSNVEIYSFSYHPEKRQLIYDVYDLQRNASYIIEQDLKTTMVSDEKNLANSSILDLVPFTAL